MACTPLVENLCTNPSFEVDLADWSDQGTVTRTRVTTDSWDGVAAQRILVEGAFGGALTSVDVTTGIHTVSFYIKGQPGDTGRSLFFGGALTPIIQAFELLTDDWERHGFTGNVDAATTTNLYIDTADTATVDWLLDAVLVEESGTASDYCPPSGSRIIMPLGARRRRR